MTKYQTNSIVIAICFCLLLLLSASPPAWAATLSASATTLPASAATLPASAPPGHSKVSLKIAVATNFRQMMITLKPLLAGEDLQLVLVSAATGALYQQILHGAPFDVLLAADAKRPALLEAEGLIVPGTRYTYAFGQLVLWSRQADIDVKTLLNETSAYLAIADPRLAPYGKAAMETLESLGRWQAFSGRLVQGRDVGQTLLFAVSGQAAAAFVSRAQFAQSKESLAGSVWHVPPSCHQPIRQQAVVLARSQQRAAAQRFVERLLGHDSQQLIRQSGYGEATQQHSLQP